MKAAAGYLKMDMLLLAGVLALVGMGIVIIYSSSAAHAELHGLSDSHYLLSHVKKVAVGFVALLLGLTVGFRVWERLARPMMLICLLLLAFLLTSSVAGSVNGARRWISIASFGLQPSELAKVALVFFLARFLTEKEELMGTFSRGLLPSLAVSLLAFLLILNQPNYSTAATVLVIATCMVYAGGCRLGHLLGLALVGLPALFGLMVSSPYRMQRVLAFLNPAENPASSYQSQQALISLGNGGLWGTGLGTSTQKLGYLPMPFTDTIFSILGEELGFAGTSLCLALFALVIWRGLRIAYSCTDRFGSLAAFGIVMAVAANVIMHIGVCARFFPTTGQPLPFLSYGGTALCTVLFGMGVLLNISGHACEQMPLSWRSNPRRWRLVGPNKGRIPSWKPAGSDWRGGQKPRPVARKPGRRVGAWS